MKMHQVPDDYQCPFCALLEGIETELNTKGDIFYQDEMVTGFISPRSVPNNEGLVMIIPNQHYENIFDIETASLCRIAEVSQKIALCMISAYEGCTGITMRQHNGYDGSQRVWHYHLHIIPRYPDDGYERCESGSFAPKERRHVYAQLLRDALLQSHAIL